MTRPPRYLYLPPVPRVRPAGSWNPRIGFVKVRRPQSVPVGRFLRPVQGIPLTGGQQQGVIGSPGPAGVLPAIVQSKSIPNALSGSFTNPTMVGNTVVVVVNAFNITSGNVPSISGVTLGGAADHFTAGPVAVTGFVTSTYLLAGIWIDYNCAGGQTAVAVSGSNLSVNAGFGITIYEVSGLTVTNPIDKQSTGASVAAGTAWSSGTTALTSAAYQIWFGANSSNGNAVQPASPWVNLEYSASGCGGGYDIVSAAGTAAYAGTQTSATWAAAVVTLTAASQPGSPIGIPGQATISVGPQGLGNVWYPAQVTVQTSSGAADASTCSIYLGPAGVPVTLVATIFPGGIGTAALAVPPLQPGDYLIAQWTGGNPGDAAAVNVIGTMDSLMPG